MIVENKGGASGSIGTAAVAAAPPDGYTFAVVFDTHGVNPSLIPNLPFDTRKDLAPVILVGTSPMVLATHAGSEYKTFADVVAAAKAKKNVSYGPSAPAAWATWRWRCWRKNGGLDWTHVPYKGGGPLMQDAWPATCRCRSARSFVTKPHIDSKRLRPLAVTTSKRARRTARRADGGRERLSPASTRRPGGPCWPRPRRRRRSCARMNEEMNKALKVPEVAAQAGGPGHHRRSAARPRSARTFIDRQIDTWAKVVKDNNIKAD